MTLIPGTIRGASAAARFESGTPLGVCAPLEKVKSASTALHSNVRRVGFQVEYVIDFLWRGDDSLSHSHIFRYMAETL